MIWVLIHTIFIECHDYVDFAFFTVNAFLLPAVLYDIVSDEARCPLGFATILQLWVVHDSWCFREAESFATHFELFLTSAA